jgi:MraZ protein
MHGFVSHYTNKLDAKGRVSIPASFRQVLARDGFEGLYCYPSPFLAAVDAGGNALLSEIESRLSGIDTLTAEYDLMSTALFGNSEILKVDAEGRVILSDFIRAHTGIADRAVFVGQGYKFQIWAPETFEAHRAEAMRRALDVLGGARAATAAAGEG